MLATGCIIKLNHDHYLVLRTALPLLILLGSFLWRRRLLSKPSESRQAFADQLLTINFVIAYLLFPSNSARIFATWQCETLFEHPQQVSFCRASP